jgi:uncharacterized RDD family membrane protein YckC
MPKVLFRDLPDAGLWRRLAAGFYDGLLLLSVWFVLGFVVAVIESALNPPDMQGVIRPLVPDDIAPFVTLPVLWLVSALFYGWFWWHGGQTLGMKTWRLRLVTADGRPLTLRNLLLRAVIGTFSLLLFAAGFLWVLVARRTWHDLASRTRVVVLPKP